MVKLRFFKSAKNIIKFISVIGLGVILLYISNIAVQLFNNFAKSTKGEETFINYNPFTGIYSLFEKGFGVPVLIGIGVILLVCLLYKGYRKLITKEGNTSDDGTFKFSQKGTYGTAQPLNLKQAKKVFDIVPKVTNSNGTLLGYSLEKKNNIIFLNYQAKYNRNVMVVGGPGSGKSACYVSNQIMQTLLDSEENPHSLIITDTKGELYSRFSEMAKSYGYTVRILNLVEIEKSDGWNALASLGEDENMVDTFAHTIISNTSGAKAEGFFEDLCLNLLKALTLYEIAIAKEQGRTPTFSHLCKHLESWLDDTTRRQVDATIKTDDKFIKARIPWNYFNADEKFILNTLISLGTRLNVIQSSKIRTMLEHNDIDLELPGQKKCCYFVRISDQDETYAFLSSLFFSFSFKKLASLADTQLSQQLEVPVTFIMDEFCNLGVITEVEKKFSTLRGRGIGIHAVIQSLPQIQSRYPNGLWEEIISDCDTLLFLGCTDLSTAEWISKKTGESTIAVESNKTTLGSFEAASSTTSTGKRPVYTVNEILTLDRDNELIFLSGQNVLSAKKYFFKNHPLSEKIEAKNVSEHIPEYTLNKPANQGFSNSKNKDNDDTSNYDNSQHKSKEKSSDNNISSKETTAKAIEDEKRNSYNQQEYDKKESKTINAVREKMNF